jgi:hypothetical protein
VYETIQVERIHPFCCFTQKAALTPVEMYHGDRSLETFTERFQQVMQGESLIRRGSKMELNNGLSVLKDVVVSLDIWM